MTDPNRPTFDFSDEPAGGNGGAASNNNNAAGFGSGEAGPAAEQQRDHGGYKGAHPIAAFFHVAFKVGALLTYILGGIFAANYVVKFVITVLFCAADFWVTKSVTGRILVALRWWNEVKEDGSTQWVFESAPDSDNRVNAYDNWFFWITMGVYTVVWLVLCVFNLLSPSALPMVLVGFLLAGANLLGYVKCRRDAQSKVTQFMMSRAAAQPGMVASAASAVAGARE